VGGKQTNRNTLVVHDEDHHFVKGILHRAGQCGNELAKRWRERRKTTKWGKRTAASGASRLVTISQIYSWIGRSLLICTGVSYFLRRVKDSAQVSDCLEEEGEREAPRG